MSILDTAIVIVYLVVVVAIGLSAGRRARSASDYFVARGQVPTWVVGFTMMATIISSNTVVAHPGIAFQQGLILVPGLLTIPIILVLVARYVVPFYRRVIGLTAYEYIGRRFGIGGRLYAALGFILERTFDVGVTLVTTAIPIGLLTGWNMMPTIVGVGLITIAYTAIGGIRAVVWTDAAQGLIMFGGAIIIVMRLIFAPEAGAPFAVVEHAYEAGRLSFGSTAMSWRDLFDSQSTASWILLIAIAIQWSRRYVCDQHMVQRYLIAPSDRDASRGVLIGAALTVPILLAFNLIGALLYGFYSLSGAVPPAIADQIMPHFILNYLPHGVIGLCMAAILAASMSSISSDLNSLSTVLTSDFVKRFTNIASERTQLVVARLMVFVIGAVAVMVASLLVPTADSAPIAERALTVAVIVASGSLGLFSLGFFTRAATRRGCYVGIATGALFTLWGVLTEPGNRYVDLGHLSFPLKSIIIGIAAHVVVFASGYLASTILGGYRPADLDDLVVKRVRSRQG